MMRAPVLAAAVLLALSPARADMPFNADFDYGELILTWPQNKEKREWPDGPVKDFLRDLERPDNDKHPERFDKADRFCCDAGDTVKTKFMVEPGGRPYPEDRWYAWLDERWVRIPSDKIVPGYAPDGQAYLFIMDFGSDEGGYKTIVCFVRPKGGL
jgi:hypothetical protein